MLLPGLCGHGPPCSFQAWGFYAGLGTVSIDTRERQDGDRGPPEDVSTELWKGVGAGERKNKLARKGTKQQWWQPPGVTGSGAKLCLCDKGQKS